MKSSGSSARHAYECLRNLLNRNTLLLEQMSEIEADLGFYLASSPYIQRKINRMADETLLLTEDLNVLSRERFSALYRTSLRIRAELADALHERSTERSGIPLSVPLEEAGHAPRGLVGNKAANLGKVRDVLPDHVPTGFVITTEAYWRFMHESGLFPALLPVLREMEAIQDADLLNNRLETIRERIRSVRLPADIREKILRQTVEADPGVAWAVRSSAEGEDGRFSFAGLFESYLNVTGKEVIGAYVKVIESRYRRRAFQYRRSLGMREIDTPMAVLFLRQVEARSAGVLYTRNPENRQADDMLIQSVWGLGQNLVAGKMEADRFRLSRHDGETLLEEQACPKPEKLVGNPRGGVRLEHLPREDAMGSSLHRRDLKHLWTIGQVLERHFGMPMDIEWAIDAQGKVWVVQARKLVVQDPEDDRPTEESTREKAILEGGVPIHAGRASGPLVRVTGARLPQRVQEGSILVLPVATPEIATLLSSMAGCISETGNPAGHAASLLREWKVPSLFGLKDALNVLEEGEVIGLDATQRKVYRGTPWPEPTEKRESRDPVQASCWDEDPLCRRIFPLRLTDPASPRFRAEGCSSLHDIIRFVHEKAVESLFLLGDRQSGRRTMQAKRLQADIPLNIMALDLGRAFPEDTGRRQALEPHQIASVPFQALWRGISDPRVSWAGRKQVSLKGFSSVLVSSLSASGAGSRKLGDQNYLLAARDYMNMNLRLAYHYTMVDALVGESPENNVVNFRFRGGGAGMERRELRARFLSETLLRSRFAVDRRGDLITAWLRRYPRTRCEEALEMLGRLLACSRQLDMLIGSTGIAHDYAERFLDGDYEAFS
jgi:pyruvate,water dikinase